MNHNIIVESGKSRLLKTAGKVCDRDIVVTAIGGSGGNSRLPAGYTEVEYLQSDGNQYVDLCWTPRSGEVLTLDVALSSGIGESAFGGCADQFELYFKGLSSSSMTLAVWSNYTKVTTLQIPSGTIAYNQKYTLQVRFDSTQSTGTVYLFRYRLDKYPFAGRIWPAVVTDPNGNDVHHYVTCFDSEGEYGLLDIVTGEFHGNLGSGSFTGGPIVQGNVEQATPEISVSNSGLITVVANQEAGYIEAGTKTVTQQLPIKEAATFVPTTSDQTIDPGLYLVGVQTIKGDSNLVASNIKEGVTIFDVLGTCASGGGGQDYPVYDGEPIDITETELTDRHAVFKAETEPMIVDGQVAVKMNKNDLGAVMAEQVPEGYTFTSKYGINQVGKMPVYDYTPIEGHYYRDDGDNFVFDAPVESFVVLEDEVSVKVPKQDFGNTYPHMVVDGWEFTSAGGVKQKGTMPIYDYTPLEGSFAGDDDDNILFMAASPQQQVVEDDLWVSVPRDDFGNAKPEDVTEGVVFTSAEGYRQVGTHKCSGGGSDRTAMEDGLVARTLTEYINNTVTQIGNYAFGNFTSLEYVSLPNVTTLVGGNHFASCTNLRVVDIPNLKTSINSSGNNFRGCTSLTELRFPQYNGVVSVSGCTALKMYECATPYNIAASAFGSLPSFDTLIMHCTKVVPLANISAFTGTPFAAGGTGGKVYVPQEYIEGYKTATNWSSLYEAGTCEFIAIEGSEYE